MRIRVFALAVLLSCSGLVAQTALNNDGVLKLIKAALSEDLIVSTINGSPGHYDTSADAIIALKSGGATDKEVSAIVLKAAGVTSPPPPNVPTAGTLPSPPANTIALASTDKEPKTANTDGRSHPSLSLRNRRLFEIPGD